MMSGCAKLQDLVDGGDDVEQEPVSSTEPLTSKTLSLLAQSQDSIKLVSELVGLSSSTSTFIISNSSSDSNYIKSIVCNYIPKHNLNVLSVNNHLRTLLTETSFSSSEIQDNVNYSGSNGWEVVDDYEGIYEHETGRTFYGDIYQRELSLNESYVNGIYKISETLEVHERYELSTMELENQYTTAVTISFDLPSFDVMPTKFDLIVEEEGSLYLESE